MTRQVDVDVTGVRFRSDPYPVYAHLRAYTPVCRVALPGGQGAWWVTRYQEVLALLKDDRFAKDRLNTTGDGPPAPRPWMPGFARPLQRNMLDLDPPDHTRLRGLVHKAFTPRMVENLRTLIETQTEQLLDAGRDGRRLDLIADYARPLPTVVIAHLLGIPAADRGRFHRWSARIVSADSSPWAMALALPCLILFLRFIRRLVRFRRLAPGEDLVSRLVAAEEAGDVLSEDELVAMIFLLLVAGFETTVNLIGNGTLALLQHPEQLERLRAEPALVETAVEELLRFDGPLRTATERYARRDVVLDGATIRRGELVFAVLASANRDEREFEDPDRLDLSREPNRHLAFGQGIHYCLGAPLARLEGRIAFTTSLRRFPGLRLASPVGRLRWRKGMVLRDLESLPVELRKGG